MVQEKGFLISYLKYGENDAVLHIYTHSEGYKSYFLKGIYSKRNRKKALLQFLFEIQFTTNPKVSGLPLISDLQAYGHLPEWNIKTNALQFFIADVLSNILRNEAQNESIYSKISDFIDQLKEENISAHVHFLVILTEDFGIKPLLNDSTYLNPEKGVYEPFSSHHCFDDSTSGLWKSILEEGYAVKLTNVERRRLLESILVYYSIHIPEFKNPASLEVLQQIWA
ncbi:DNA repair protein RecO [Elizabethkingia anophelis]|uniref:DNA repair protein RecO n=1 Tax=Elizabethkingia anophelis TaxID=1117645 RepID=UPI001371CFF0|nr:recombination protein O N-terminal domain-containing protein [Elizabethkingia anophelis]MCT4122753.1 recombination protein O N-terminal domain-containing protein [Elizabethkingia anophelis]MYY43618.1 DNA recombination protein RecO [Elizabethkingia anophelis]